MKRRTSTQHYIKQFDASPVWPHRSATMALQVLRAEQHPFEVTTVTVEQVPWFKGRDVAACLGYVGAWKAVKDHVDEEDRKTYAELTTGRPSEGSLHNQQPHEVYINEAGLYSLAMRSKKPQAKAFKR